MSSLDELCGFDLSPKFIHPETGLECDNTLPNAKLKCDSAREVLRNSIEKELKVVKRLFSLDDDTLPTVPSVVDGGKDDVICNDDWKRLKCLSIEPAYEAFMADTQVLAGNNCISDCSRLQKRSKTSIATNQFVSWITLDNIFDSFHPRFGHKKGQLHFQDFVEEEIANSHTVRNETLNKMLHYIDSLQEAETESNVNK